MEYSEEDAKFDRMLDAIEAKMNLDCPDSYQIRGMKEEEEEECLDWLYNFVSSP